MMNMLALMLFLYSFLDLKCFMEIQFSDLFLNVHDKCMSLYILYVLTSIAYMIVFKTLDSLLYKGSKIKSFFNHKVYNTWNLLKTMHTCRWMSSIVDIEQLCNI